MEGSCSTDLSGLNIITLRQIAVDDSLPPDVYIARIANAVQVATLYSGDKIDKTDLSTGR